MKTFLFNQDGRSLPRTFLFYLLRLFVFVCFLTGLKSGFFFFKFRTIMKTECVKSFLRGSGRLIRVCRREVLEK